MERREFLGSLTGPVAAVCAVCLGACSKSADGGTAGNTTAPSANFTVDLSSNLTTIGSSLAANSVLIVRLAAGNTPSSFVAVQQACTHQGTSINYVPSNQIFLCPNHGAQYNTAGANVGGQASASLKVYTITIAGNTMTVAG